MQPSEEASGGNAAAGGTGNLPCTVTEVACSCIAGSRSATLAGNAESCGTEWSCCIYAFWATASVDWTCECADASEAECYQLLADAFPTAEQVASCPLP